MWWRLKILKTPPLHALVLQIRRQLHCRLEEAVALKNVAVRGERMHEDLAVAVGTCIETCGGAADLERA